ncbi:MAG: 1-(5-phosphoribosyl)-5-[(5-phosphoribosylamino)methylideneamino]imidazole-4-carboxamide isomerase [Robiginitomaculum sp.]|nr:MAG: 1-(5-phosphoribosyl)-5-[(5-phosphoribosylamino)methylideneamino]imidazole-4-carboxamide isomerase [Robiginitomaculum sp.]
MIYPAIDLMDGKCVRLFKGDFNQRTDYEISPLEMARSFAEQGAEWIHVVDLDGAKNEKSQQGNLITDIAKQSGLKVQTGGGLREISQLQNLINGGVERVVIGSLAVSNPAMVKYWITELGPERFTLALDVQIDATGTPRPATRGWQDASEKTLWHVLDQYMDTGVKSVLVTDIAKDGVLQGSNTGLYADILRRYSAFDLITSGGVGSIKDVQDLKALDPAGIIIGKALYENKFTLEQAISC